MKLFCSLLSLILTSFFVPIASQSASTPVPAAAAKAAKLHAISKLQTESELSGWTKTGRYEEVPRLCQEFEKKYPQAARCLRWGVSPAGRPMVALLLSGEGAFDARSIQAKNRPLALFQGGIHAGEIDGKDAIFWAAREILEGRQLPGVLKDVSLLFVPVFNVDGHERFGTYNRPNQIGPEQMGWRTTAHNLNLNRDYLKIEAPEMVLMLKLIRDFDPILYVDLHVTDGAQFEHDVGYIFQPTTEAFAGLVEQVRNFQKNVLEELKAKGHHPLPFYPNFKTPEDPSSGVEFPITPPRFSDGYIRLRNRIAVLVETHSWKPYPIRVQTTYNTILAMIGQLQKNGLRWRSEAMNAEKAALALAGKPYTLEYEVTPKSRPIEMKGYRYERRASDVSGSLITSYDLKKPEIWKIDFFDELKPKTRVQIPAGGYLIPPSYAALLRPKFDSHGIKYESISISALIKKSQFEAEVFRARDVNYEAGSFEGRTRVQVQGEWKTEKVDTEPGRYLYVASQQPLIHLIVALLEPEGADSLVAWGFMNSVFERKEYMEDYVLEPFAKELLAKKPELKETFLKRVETDPSFAKDPAKRLDFFYELHPSWDAQYRRIPYFRIKARPETNKKS